MYPHVQGRLCTHSNLCKQRKHGNRAQTELRTGMGRASAGRCRACPHDGHARAWRTHAMNMYAHAKGFVDIDCVDVNAAGNLQA